MAARCGPLECGSAALPAPEIEYKYENILLTITHRTSSQQAATAAHGC